MTARRGLGKGLDALIPAGEEPEGGGNALQIPIALIEPNPSQPRGEIQDESLQELADSIREHGILQPLILSKEGDPEKYTLIAGERRLRAAKLVGLDFVPAMLRDATDQQRLEWALIENLQREDLTALEAAEAYQQLIDEFGLTHDQIASRVGKNRTTVTNTLRLLKLPESAREALTAGRISEGHARALLGLPSEKAQAAALQTILAQDLNVRQTEQLIHKLAGEKPTPNASQSAKSPQISDIENVLRSALGTKVTLKHGKKGGTLVIHYYSDEELDELIERIRRA